MIALGRFKSLQSEENGLRVFCYLLASSCGDKLYQVSMETMKTID
jgi:hypothetical protein